MGARPVHAQTNVQLYGQLLALDWPDADLARVRAAHDLATRLHAARFRPSGRPFLAHLVGTASALAWLGCGPDLVLAGLLHAVYDQGDFGDGRRAMSSPKRASVRRAVGARVEELVAGYTRLGWSLDVLAAVESRLESLGDLDRDVLRVRLANELDDHLDLDVLYGAGRSERLAYLAAAAPRLSALACFLGHDDLARAFDETAAACRDARVPGALASEHPYCFDVVPRSCVRRPVASWNLGRPWRAWQRARARRWLRRQVGRLHPAG